MHGDTGFGPNRCTCSTPEVALAWPSFTRTSALTSRRRPRRIASAMPHITRIDTLTPAIAKPMMVANEVDGAVLRWLVVGDGVALLPVAVDIEVAVPAMWEAVRAAELDLVGLLVKSRSDWDALVSVSGLESLEGSWPAVIEPAVELDGVDSGD